MSVIQAFSLQGWVSESEFESTNKPHNIETPDVVLTLRRGMKYQCDKYHWLPVWFGVISCEI
jgi:hypothetical protein